MFPRWIILASLTSKAAALSRRGMDEYNILANCIDSSNGSQLKISQMAYYATSPDTKGARPQVVAETARGQTTLWEDSVTSGTFPDGNVFTVTIGPPVAQGQFAGTGKASQGDFSCWFNYRKGLYIWDAFLCDGIYDCNRQAPPSTTSSSVRPSTTMSSRESSAPPPATTPLADSPVHSQVSTPSTESPVRPSPTISSIDPPTRPSPTTSSKDSSTDASTYSSAHPQVTSSLTESSVHPSDTTSSTDSSETRSTSSVPTSPSPDNTAEKKDSVTKASEIGTIVGSVVGFLVFIGAIFGYWSRWRKKRVQKQRTVGDGGDHELSNRGVGIVINHYIRGA